MITRRTLLASAAVSPLLAAGHSAAWAQVETPGEDAAATPCHHPRTRPARRPDRGCAAAADRRAAGDVRGLRRGEAGRGRRPRRRRRRRPGRRGRLPAGVRGSRAGTAGAGHGRHPAADRLGHQVVQLAAGGHPRRRRAAELGDAAGRSAADLRRRRPGSHAATDGPRCLLRLHRPPPARPRVHLQRPTRSPPSADRGHGAAPADRALRREVPVQQPDGGGRGLRGGGGRRRVADDLSHAYAIALRERVLNPIGMPRTTTPSPRWWRAMTMRSRMRRTSPAPSTRCRCWSMTPGWCRSRRPGSCGRVRGRWCATSRPSWDAAGRPGRTARRLGGEPGADLAAGRDAPGRAGDAARRWRPSPALRPGLGRRRLRRAAADLAQWRHPRLHVPGHLFAGGGPRRGDPDERDRDGRPVHQRGPVPAARAAVRPAGGDRCPAGDEPRERDRGRADLLAHLGQVDPAAVTPTWGAMPTPTLGEVALALQEDALTWTRARSARSCFLGSTMTGRDRYIWWPRRGRQPPEAMFTLTMPAINHGS